MFYREMDLRRQGYIFDVCSLFAVSLSYSMLTGRCSYLCSLLVLCLPASRSHFSWDIFDVGGSCVAYFYDIPQANED